MCASYLVSFTPTTTSTTQHAVNLTGGAVKLSSFLYLIVMNVALPVSNLVTQYPTVVGETVSCNTALAEPQKNTEQEELCVTGPARSHLDHQGRKVCVRFCHPRPDKATAQSAAPPRVGSRPAGGAQGRAPRADCPTPQPHCSLLSIIQTMQQIQQIGNLTPLHKKNMQKIS